MSVFLYLKQISKIVGNFKVDFAINKEDQENNILYSYYSQIQSPKNLLKTLL